MLALAATWDDDLVNLVAAAIGTEFKAPEDENIKTIEKY